jgi:hypothetical protein
MSTWRPNQSKLKHDAGRAVARRATRQVGNIAHDIVCSCSDPDSFSELIVGVDAEVLVFLICVFGTVPFWSW